MDAADQLILRNGHVGINITELTTEAGTSMGRIYYWFKDVPAVLDALAARGIDRMTALFAEILDFEDAVATPRILHDTIVKLCGFVNENPGMVGLCIGGPLGPQHGVVLRQALIDVSRLVVLGRVPDAPEAEIALVAEMAVSLTLGILMRFISASDELKPLLQQELVYVLSAWLFCRYPSPNLSIWDDPEASVQPARRPLMPAPGSTFKVYPALSPNQPL